jgi:hypothetical protein
VQFILVSAAEDATSHALITRLSHCQHDGFSIPILFDDLAAAYEAASSLLGVSSSTTAVSGPSGVSPRATTSGEITSLAPPRHTLAIFKGHF